MDSDGVYLIGYRNTETDKRYTVYVGQGAMSDRLSDHLKKNSCIKRRLSQTGRAGYYRYARVENEDDRLDIELGLYHNHGATKLCNEVEPPGSGRQGTIEVEEQFP